MLFDVRVFSLKGNLILPTRNIILQMVANGAVLVQQQTSSGLQLILKSTAPPQPKHGGLVITNGSPLPQTLILQGRTQAHQVR